MDARLLFQLGDGGKIDLFHRQAVQAGVQQNVQLQDRLIVQAVADGNDFVLHHIAFRYHNRQQLIFADHRQLDEFQLRPVILRRGNHGGVVGIGCQDLGHLL